MVRPVDLVVGLAVCSKAAIGAYRKFYKDPFYCKYLGKYNKDPEVSIPEIQISLTVTFSGRTAKT